MARLFFAVWPDSAVRDALAAVAQQFPAGRGRVLPPENLHITLVFLGEVDDDCRAQLVERAAAVRAERFDLGLDHSGWWRRPQVAWLAPSAVPGPMVQLVNALTCIARDCGLRVEERSYRAHLSIARRVSRPPPALAFQPIHWEINEFCLTESVTEQGGARYRICDRWPLTGA